MRFVFAHRLATVLTAMTAFAAVSVGGNLSLSFVVLWFAGGVWALFVPDGRFSGRIVLAVAIFALPVAVVLAVRGLDLVAAAAYYTAALLLVRLLCRDDTDSHAQVHLLSVLVLAGGAALSPDLTYLVCFVAYLFAATWALLLTQLRREIGASALALPVREVVGGGLSAGVFALTAVALVATAAVFVIFPRTPISLGFRRPVGGAAAGLSDRVTLAGFGRIKENDQVVLRVLARDGRFEDNDLPFYWRAHVFERYDGRTWTAERLGRGEEPSRLVELGRGNAGAAALALDVEVVTDPGSPVLPVPDHAVRVQFHERDAAGSRPRVRRFRAGELRLSGNPVEPYRFFTVWDAGVRTVDRTPATPEETALPEQHPGVVALARQLRAQSGPGDRAFATEVERHLSETFGYTLDLPGFEPSLEHFLLERKEGHCEYFATAMAVLLRLEGVPARVVTGYYGGAWNEAGDYHVVRQGDAHAWVEVWHEGSGWERYEPTPPAGRGRARGTSLAERLADAWDALQERWSHLVLDYDLRSQVEGFREIGRALSKVGDAFRGKKTPLADRVVPILVVVLMLVVGYVSYRTLRRGGWRRRDADGLVPDARRAQAVYRSLLRALGKAGYAKAPGETPEDLLARLPPPAAQRARPVVDRYQASRFGGRGLTPDEARALEERVRAVSRAIAGDG